LTDTLIRSLEDFKKKLDLDAPRMLSLPDVALRIQSAASDPDASPEMLAKVIVEDAQLSAQLIRVANSPLARTRSEIRTVAQAAMRLGVNLVRDMSLAFALQNSFKPRTEFVHRELKKTWAESKEIAALSSALATFSRKLPPDQALLAGLIHRIGALPLLTALDEWGVKESEYAEAAEAVEELHPELGGEILRSWGFDEDMACIPETFRNPCRPGSGKPDLADAVAMAYVIQKLGTSKAEWQAPMSAYDSAARLGLDCDIESLEAFYDSELVDQGRGLLA
jgi:HD-like signal output (HDOD) protein